MLKVRFIGLASFLTRIKVLGASFRGEMEDRLKEASEVLVRSAQEQFKGSRTRSLMMPKAGGWVTRKPPRKVTSPADQLGVFEGTYRKSITYRIEKEGRGMTSTVGPVGISYAAIHEFGGSFRAFGRRAATMPKRPVFEPAIKETKEEIFKILGRSFKLSG